MPVSSLSCTAMGRPLPAARFWQSNASRMPLRVGINCQCRQARNSSGWVRLPSTNTGCRNPAWRSSTPSCRVATPKLLAPPAAAARATGTAPWP